MTEVEQQPPPQNGIDLSATEDEDNSKARPADIEQDMREMERRKRVEAIMGSKLFREELERIVDAARESGGAAGSGILQQLSDIVGLPMPRVGNVFRSTNSNCMIPINDIRGVESMGYAKGEKILRCKLAATFRLLDLYGWAQGGGSGGGGGGGSGLSGAQITARLKVDQEEFLVNPYGLLYHEITASSLNKVDMQGHVVEQGTTNFGVDRSHFILHSAVHAARPDIRCAIYIGCAPVVAISSLRNGLLPITKDSCVLGEITTHVYTGSIFEAEERDKLVRTLGPNSKVMLLSNHGALCCGETIEEAFFAASHIVQASETQLKLLPVGIDNLILIPEESRKVIYEQSRRPPADLEKKFAAVEITPQEGAAEAAVTVVKPSTNVPKWRVGGAEFEALMRMLDNAGYRTGYIYRHPLIKSDPPKPKNDVELPPAVSSLGYLLEEEELFRQGIWKKGDLRKGGDRSRWLNSPNVYQKVEVLETGTPDPKKITKWVAEGSPTHSTPVRIEDPLQFVPAGTNPREFKRLQQQIKDNRRADKISAGPQSHILEGVTWDEANRMKDATVSSAGDHVVLMGAASKGIIQRGYQHNAAVYKAPYAKNPFDNVTDDELNEYKRTVERKKKSIHGEYTDTDFSESEPLSSLQTSGGATKQHTTTTATAAGVSQSEPEDISEHQVMRVETQQAPVPSQAEVVLSDATLSFINGERSHTATMQKPPTGREERNNQANYEENYEFYEDQAIDDNHDDGGKRKVLKLVRLGEQNTASGTVEAQRGRRRKRQQLPPPPQEQQEQQWQRKNMITEMKTHNLYQSKQAKCSTLRGEPANLSGCHRHQSHEKYTEGHHTPSDRLVGQAEDLEVLGDLEDGDRTIVDSDNGGGEFQLSYSSSSFYQTANETLMPNYSSSSLASLSNLQPMQQQYRHHPYCYCCSSLESGGGEFAVYDVIHPPSSSSSVIRCNHVPSSAVPVAASQQSIYCYTPAICEQIFAAVSENPSEQASGRNDLIFKIPFSAVTATCAGRGGVATAAAHELQSAPTTPRQRAAAHTNSPNESPRHLRRGIAPPPSSPRDPLNRERRQQRPDREQPLTDGQRQSRHHSPYRTVSHFGFNSPQREPKPVHKHLPPPGLTDNNASTARFLPLRGAISYEQIFSSPRYVDLCESCFEQMVRLKPELLQMRLHLRNLSEYLIPPSSGAGGAAAGTRSDCTGAVAAEPDDCMSLDEAYDYCDIESSESTTTATLPQFYGSHLEPLIEETEEEGSSVPSGCTSGSATTAAVAGLTSAPDKSISNSTFIRKIMRLNYSEESADLNFMRTPRTVSSDLSLDMIDEDVEGATIPALSSKPEQKMQYLQVYSAVESQRNEGGAEPKKVSILEVLDLGNWRDTPRASTGGGDQLEKSKGVSESDSKDEREKENVSPANTTGDSEGHDSSLSQSQKQRLLMSREERGRRKLEFQELWEDHIAYFDGKETALMMDVAASSSTMAATTAMISSCSDTESTRHGAVSADAGADNIARPIQHSAGRGNIPQFAGGDNLMEGLEPIQDIPFAVPASNIAGDGNIEVFLGRSSISLKHSQVDETSVEETKSCSASNSEGDHLSIASTRTYNITPSDEDYPEFEAVNVVPVSDILEQQQQVEDVCEKLVSSDDKLCCDELVSDNDVVDSLTDYLNMISLNNVSVNFQEKMQAESDKISPEGRQIHMGEISLEKFHSEEHSANREQSKIGEMTSEEIQIQGGEFISEKDPIEQVVQAESCELTFERRQGQVEEFSPGEPTEEDNSQSPIGERMKSVEAMQLHSDESESDYSEFVSAFFAELEYNEIEQNHSENENDCLQCPNNAEIPEKQQLSFDDNLRAEEVQTDYGNYEPRLVASESLLPSINFGEFDDVECTTMTDTADRVVASINAAILDNQETADPLAMEDEYDAFVSAIEECEFQPCSPTFSGEFDVNETGICDAEFDTHGFDMHCEQEFGELEPNMILSDECNAELCGAEEKGEHNDMKVNVHDDTLHTDQAMWCGDDLFGPLFDTDQWAMALDQQPEITTGNRRLSCSESVEVKPAKESNDDVEQYECPPNVDKAMTEQQHDIEKSSKEGKNIEEDFTPTERLILTKIKELQLTTVEIFDKIDTTIRNKLTPSKLEQMLQAALLAARKTPTRTAATTTPNSSISTSTMNSTSPPTTNKKKPKRRASISHEQSPSAMATPTPYRRSRSLTTSPSSPLTFTSSVRRQSFDGQPASARDGIERRLRRVDAACRPGNSSPQRRRMHRKSPLRHSPPKHTPKRNFIQENIRNASLPRRIKRLQWTGGNPQAIFCKNPFGAATSVAAAANKLSSSTSSPAAPSSPNTTIRESIERDSRQGAASNAIISPATVATIDSNGLLEAESLSSIYSFQSKVVRGSPRFWFAMEQRHNNTPASSRYSGSGRSTSGQSGWRPAAVAAKAVRHKKHDQQRQTTQQATGQRRRRQKQQRSDNHSDEGDDADHDHDGDDVNHDDDVGHDHEAENLCDTVGTDHHLRRSSSSTTFTYDYGGLASGFNCAATTRVDDALESLGVHIDVLRPRLDSYTHILDTYLDSVAMCSRHMDDCIAVQADIAAEQRELRENIILNQYAEQIACDVQTFSISETDD